MCLKKARLQVNDGKSQLMFLPKQRWIWNSPRNFGFVVADKKLEKRLRDVLYKKVKLKELKGICGNPGKVKGKVRIIVKTKDFPKFKKGEILVTAFTTPDFTPILKKAAGIVTDFGGITSHAAIISRELGIPSVVNTEEATKNLKNGDNQPIEVTSKGLMIGQVESHLLLKQEKNFFQPKNLEL